VVTLSERACFAYGQLEMATFHRSLPFIAVAGLLCCATPERPQPVRVQEANERLLGAVSWTDGAWITLAGVHRGERLTDALVDLSLRWNCRTSDAQTDAVCSARDTAGLVLSIESVDATVSRLVLSTHPGVLERGACVGHEVLVQELTRRWGRPSTKPNSLCDLKRADTEWQLAADKVTLETSMGTDQNAFIRLSVEPL
jgi:hypothetical protein